MWYSFCTNVEMSVERSAFEGMVALYDDHGRESHRSLHIVTQQCMLFKLFDVQFVMSSKPYAMGCPVHRQSGIKSRTPPNAWAMQLIRWKPTLERSRPLSSSTPFPSPSRPVVLHSQHNQSPLQALAPPRRKANPHPSIPTRPAPYARLSP